MGAKEEQLVDISRSILELYQRKKVSWCLMVVNGGQWWLMVVNGGQWWLMVVGGG